MSMAEAAALVGVSQDTVRRYVDEQEAAGTPVAERDRDERGRPKPLSWRRPYLSAMQAWKDRRAGLVPETADGEA